MKHNEMFSLYFFIAIIILVLFIIYKSRLNIIISIDIDNNTKLIKLNIKYLFNLLNTGGNAPCSAGPYALSTQSIV